ncbi:unnamed protein product [Mycena citricolor]|uniref:Uncharacterized protein n=1 Tax=Mycena citricolor TaxID=2018698 RepID=A0AAD2HN54_9AGAR|nr:unnamed protein product [Mycena citricolor]
MIDTTRYLDPFGCRTINLSASVLLSPPLHCTHVRRAAQAQGERELVRPVQRVSAAAGERDGGGAAGASGHRARGPEDIAEHRRGARGDEEGAREEAACGEDSLARSVETLLVPPSLPPSARSDKAQVNLNQERFRFRSRSPVHNALNLALPEFRFEKYVHGSRFGPDYLCVTRDARIADFRIAFTPKYFESERLLWKTVIQMNLIRPRAPPRNGPSRGARQIAADERARAAGAVSVAAARVRDEREQFDREQQERIHGHRPRGLGMEGEARRGLRRVPFAHRPDVAHGGRPDRSDAPAGCVLAEISALWADVSVREILKSHAVALEEEPGFFMDDAARITSLAYVPTDRDIVRARIKTLGVEEHRFVTESGFRAGTEFFITDVCGSSSQVTLLRFRYNSEVLNYCRTSQAGYLVQAILFLAPLAFWQYLDEDTKVNRVQDSLELWREIIANPLLSKTAFILLFNKKDILQAQLDTGISVAKYVPSFGDRPNTVSGVTKCECPLCQMNGILTGHIDFRDKFSAYYAETVIFYETEAIVGYKIDELNPSRSAGADYRNHLKDLDVM